MTGTNATISINPDARSGAALLASDPLDWARRATILVYDRHAAPLASRASRRAQRLDSDGDRASAATVRRDAVNQLRHACTNYEELVGDVAAHYGRGRRDDVIAIIRDRMLRALAHRFPTLADACRTLADERKPPRYRLPGHVHSLARGVASVQPNRVHT